MIITRPIHQETNDLLIGYEFAELIVTDLEGAVCTKLSPRTKWTHDLLEKLDLFQYSPDGWNAYLGDTSNWIGSSEI